ncbi:MAG: tail fiber domain-containing protein, partial [Oleispira sp.]|nr:tail fiber domain-containing protein [Oleispira sp.]
QADMMDKARNSAFYTGQVGASDEAIMRSNNVTGGLRGGGTAVDLANYESNLLNQSYQNELQGIQGLAGLQTNDNAIGQSMSNIGAINAQGITAGAQSKQDANNNMMQAGAMAFSDMRLKENIVRIGETSNPGIGVYSWSWKPGCGKEGTETGFLAQEIEKHYPDYVVTLDDGYKRIYKEKLEEILL